MPASNNQFKTTDKITDAVLAHLYTNFQFVQTSYRKFNQEDWLNPTPIGGSLRYREPTNFNVAHTLDTTNASDRSEIVQREKYLTIDKKASIHVDTDIVQETLDYNEYLKNEDIKTMGRNMAVDIEKRVVDAIYPETYLTAGTVGSNLSIDGVYDLAGIVADYGIHLEKFYFGVPNRQISKLGAQVSQINNETFSGRSLDKGWVGELGGVNMFKTEFTGHHQSGEGGLGSGSAPSGLPDKTTVCGQISTTVSSSNTTPVTSIELKNLPTSTNKVLRKGDILILGWNSDSRFFNYYTRMKKEGYVQVAVKEDVDSDGSGNATVPIFTPLYTEGLYKNASEEIAENAYCAVYNSHNFGIAYREEGIVFAMPKLRKGEGGAVWSQREVDKNNEGRMPISLTFLKDYDSIKAVQIYKFMALFGVQANPRVMVRYMF